MDSSTSLAHQFTEIDQQREAVNLGMWAFLVTEVMFFGGVLTSFFVMLSLYGPAFEEASSRLNVILGAVNTAVLICSSLTMALAVRSAQNGRQRQLVWFLIVTIVLGTAFLVIKGFEYSHKFHENLFPGPDFVFAGPNGREAQLFFVLYFVMTGLHAAHMIIGIGIMAVLAYRARRGDYTQDYYAPVDVSGLYWHFVDIVWIYLFPLLYLIGRN